jgi:ParB family chromosome partitioning protein
VTAVADTLAGAELLDLDPHELLAHSNIRSDLGDLEGLTASVSAVGVLEPVIVAPNGDGRLHVVAGFRRVAAAAAAGKRVPCLLRPDLAAGPTALVAQLAENLRREDLTTAEEAAGYEQLAAFGLDEEAIAVQVGSDPEVVSKSIGLAKAPRAMAVSAKYFLTLGDSLAIAEFEDDPEAIKVLTVALQREPQRFPHVLSRARQDREHRLKREQIVRDLGDVPLLAKEPGYYGLTKGKPGRLDRCCGEDGKPITLAKHRKCPGHSAFIEDGWQGPKLVWTCKDPLGNGHKDGFGGRSTSRSSAAEPSPEEKAKASEERRAVLRNNKASKAADAVRKAFLEELCLRSDPPKGSLRYAVTAILGDMRLLLDHGEALRGQELKKALDVPDARLPLLMMRLACQAMERSMQVDAWRSPPEGAGAYLRFLASAGYPLSDVEQLVIAASDKRDGARGH